MLGFIGALNGIISTVNIWKKYFQKPVICSCNNSAVTAEEGPSTRVTLEEEDEPSPVAPENTVLINMQMSN